MQQNSRSCNFTLISFVDNNDSKLFSNDCLLGHFSLASGVIPRDIALVVTVAIAIATNRASTR